jgi:acyl-CoA thioesterase II
MPLLRRSRLLSQATRVCRRCRHTAPEGEELRAVMQNIELEQVDARQYRSKRRLWVPPGARGVFGGQTLSQAVKAAQQTVDPEYRLHFLSSLFSRAGLLSSPIQYNVSEGTTGRAYASRHVTAFQADKSLLEVQLSFQRPEAGMESTSLAFPSPSSIPRPEDCPPAFGHFKSIMRTSDADKEPLHMKSVEIRARDPLELPNQAEARSDPTFTWFRFRDAPRDASDADKAAMLAYVSDRDYFPFLSYSLGVGKSSAPVKLDMAVTLNHTLHFWSKSVFGSDQQGKLIVMTATLIRRIGCSIKRPPPSHGCPEGSSEACVPIRSLCDLSS